MYSSNLYFTNCLISVIPTAIVENHRCLQIKMAHGGGDGAPIPIVHDSLTFENRQTMRIKEMEKRMEDELKKKRQTWEKEVERMRCEFLNLYPSDKRWGSDELLDDPLVSKRRGSTDVLDPKKMRTLFLEYPDAGRRYKIRFNVQNFDTKNVSVSTDGDRIIVRATKMEEDESGNQVEAEYNRKIEKPKEVDATKLKSFLTSDGILIVEAPLPPHTLNLRKLSHSPSHSSQGSHASGTSCASSSRSRSPSNSPRTPQEPKFGVPSFYDEESGRRRMSLLVNIGQYFKPKDITVQALHSNRLQVRAKHEERTSERFNKHKFHKEFELPEKIETYSLRAGVTTEGKLVIGALGKGHGTGLTKQAAGESVANDINSRATSPCNILDLAQFPPVAPPI